MIDITEAQKYAAQAKFYDALTQAIQSIAPQIGELLDGALSQQRTEAKRRNEERARR